MATTHFSASAQFVLDIDMLGRLIEALKASGYAVIGPVARDGAIVFDSVEVLADLPIGFTAQQEPAKYRLQRRNDGAVFGFAATGHSVKRFFHPPDIRLFEAARAGGAFDILPDSAPPPRLAVLGVRACDLAAISRQDRVLLRDRYVDTIYQARRQDAFIVAVNCSESSANCFCASLGTGPQAKEGYDIVLTEIIEPERHVFLAVAGSAAGEAVLAELKLAKATAELCTKGQAVLDRAAAAIEKSLNVTGLKELLFDNLEHPRWEQTATRCLGCANCTLVCPTCFCVTVEDTTDVLARRAERWRRWDSCFTQSFSYIHGGSVRLSPKSRYRQWLTHKLASWNDQFGESGCVGCGRCITWCPAGIDITEEVAAIRGKE